MKHIDFSSRKLKSLPKDLPKSVSKDFYCDDNKLTSLEGAPRIVEENFFCCDNELTSFEGAPMIVGWYFFCSNNRLISFDFLPLKYSRFSI